MWLLRISDKVDVTLSQPHINTNYNLNYFYHLSCLNLCHLPPWFSPLWNAITPAYISKGHRLVPRNTSKIIFSYFWSYFYFAFENIKGISNCSACHRCHPHYIISFITISYQQCVDSTENLYNSNIICICIRSLSFVYILLFKYWSNWALTILISELKSSQDRRNRDNVKFYAFQY